MQGSLEINLNQIPKKWIIQFKKKVDEQSSSWFWGSTESKSSDWEGRIHDAIRSALNVAWQDFLIGSNSEVEIKNPWAQWGDSTLVLWNEVLRSQCSAEGLCAIGYGLHDHQKVMIEYNSNKNTWVLKGLEKKINCKNEDKRRIASIDGDKKRKKNGI